MQAPHVCTLVARACVADELCVDPHHSIARGCVGTADRRA